MCW
ncbi:hypothetical protein D030_0068A, partial [Vibrio parahaemolyticus AQ3810]|jgi:hypothetical protein